MTASLWSCVHVYLGITQPTAPQGDLRDWSAMEAEVLHISTGGFCISMEDRVYLVLSNVFVVHRTFGLQCHM